MDFHIVDVFAEEKYQGNQLAVLIPEGDISGSDMLRIAKEIHFSETTFARPGRNADGGYDVRIFTPDQEIPFAGHPVLGTAYLINRLWESGSASRIVLNLAAGGIAVDIEGDLLTMTQNQPVFGPVVGGPEDVAPVVGLTAGDIDARYPVQVVSTGLPSVIVAVKDALSLEKCAVSHPLFREWLTGPRDCNLLLFAPEEAAGLPTLRARVFMNDSGYFEDPATGSANGNLAAYLLEHRFFGRDEIEYRVKQGWEMGRPSLLRVTAGVRGGRFLIRVGGRVQPVASGRWLG